MFYNNFVNFAVNTLVNMEKNNNIYNFVRQKYVIPFRMWGYRFLRKLLVIFILALIANFVFSYLFTTPKMWDLRDQNNLTIAQYKSLNNKIEKSVELLNQIRSRDANQYRAVFSIDTINNPLVWVDYPDEHYQNSGYGRYGELMRASEISLDRLSKQLYGQSLSLEQIEALAIDKDVMMEHLPTLWPIDRSLMKNSIGAFGMRNDPFNRGIRRHEGVDMGAPIGTPIYATGTGIVVNPKALGGYGYQILLDHKFGYKTRYAHLSKILVQEGQWVKRGEIIGLMGNTGRSKGSHLHYEVIHKGVPVNPINYLSHDMSSDEFKEIVENARETTFEQD